MFEFRTYIRMYVRAHILILLLIDFVSTFLFSRVLWFACQLNQKVTERTGSSHAEQQQQQTSKQTNNQTKRRSIMWIDNLVVCVYLPAQWRSGFDRNFSMTDHRGRFIFSFFLLVDVCARLSACARVCVCAVLLSPSFEYTHTVCVKKSRDKKYVFSRVVCVPFFDFFFFFFFCSCFIERKKSNQINGALSNWNECTKKWIRRNKKACYKRFCLLFAFIEIKKETFLLHFRVYWMRSEKKKK